MRGGNSTARPPPAPEVLLGSKRSLTALGYISPSKGIVGTLGLEVVWSGACCKERAGQTGLIACWRRLPTTVPAATQQSVVGAKRC